MRNYSDQIPELNDLTDALLQEWGLYCNLDLTLIEFNNLEEFWNKVSFSLPILNSIASIYI